MPPMTPTDPPLLPQDTTSPSSRILRAVGRERSTDWETVDWTYEREAHLRFKERKAANHREENEGIATLWFRAREAFSGWAPVLIVGCVTGVLAGMIDFSCSFLSSLRFGVCRDMPWLGFDACCPGSETHEECAYWRQWGETLESETLTWCVYCVVSVSFAVLASHLVVTYAPYAAGSGIPEIKTILSGISINRFLGAWTLLIKCVGLCLAVGSGLSLGKEGPFVHVASCVGNLVTDYYPSYKHHEAKRREVLSASCAAGVAVAFGAPIGGVLFSLEEASYYFPHKTMWKAFFCAVVAALVLKSIDPSNSGTLALFRLGYNHPWRWFELLPHCLLGGMGGVVGALFNALNVRWIRFKRTSEIKAHPVLEVFVVASVTALVNYRSPFLKTSATEVLSKIFRECGPDDTTGLCDLGSQDLRVSLVLAAVCKFWLTVFTFGTKVPAGLFVPSLFTGACLGRVMGMWVHGLHVQARSSYLFSECHGVPVNQCVIPGVYAVVGAAAVLGGVTRMTLSLVVIIFELTGGLEYLVPVIVAVMLSKIVGEWVGGEESIYERHIIMNGYPYLDPKAEAREGMAVRDLLPDTPSLYAIPNTGWTVSRVQHLLHTTTYKGFPIIRSKKERVVVGWAQRARLVTALDAAAKSFPQVGPETGVVFSGDVRNNGPACLLDASTFIDATPIQITADATVDRLLQLFKSLGLRSILVTDHCTLMGVITRKDLLVFMHAGVHSQGFQLKAAGDDLQHQDSQRAPDDASDDDDDEPDGSAVAAREPPVASPVTVLAGPPRPPVGLPLQLPPRVGHTLVLGPRASPTLAPRTSPALGPASSSGQSSPPDVPLGGGSVPLSGAGGGGGAAGGTTKKTSQPRTPYKAYPNAPKHCLRPD
eukprot:Rhum_TRINITY_DN14737_c15_g1::Rhum_TRINITY_DN14737_c15_g1_i1::g.113694::m.113694/K05012/CLCN3_4_5; chloride channel 3/4/5